MNSTRNGDVSSSNFLAIWSEASNFLLLISDHRSVVHTILLK